MSTATPALAAAGDTTRVSVDSAGAQGNNASLYGGISANGRFVAFASQATNLVPGDTNSYSDVFVHDRQTGSIERASVNSAGVEGEFGGEQAAISSDGRFVAFESYSSNLAPGTDTHGTYKYIYVRDRQTGTTERVSVDNTGTQGNAESIHPAISADGRFVTFTSAAWNLVPGDTNGQHDIFVHDRQTHSTERVSVDGAGNQGFGLSYGRAGVSDDGRFVAFTSLSSLAAGGIGNQDIFVRDRQAGTTERVSVDNAGQPGNDSSGVAGGISGDGRFVTFGSSASNLVAGDTNGRSDVFVRDRQAGTTERVSVDSAGSQATGNSFFSSPGGIGMSGNARFIVFESDAANLVAGDTNANTDIFVRDRQTNTTERVSVDNAGIQGNGQSLLPSISANGSLVAFTSSSTNLVPGDTNGKYDVFVHERPVPPDDQAVTTVPPGGGTVSTGTPGAQATPEDPVETTVVSPNGGQVVITETDSAGSPPGGGFDAVGFHVDITAPPATVDDPLVLTFRIDGSLLPMGTQPADVVLRRDGDPIASCTAPNLLDPEADPDPCIASRTADGDDVIISAFTSHASEWDAVLPSDLNHPPSTADQTVSTVEDTPLAVTLSGSDVDGDTLTFGHGAASHGQVTGSGADLIYTPAPNYYGPDSVTFSVTDSNGASASGTVHITVVSAPLIATTLRADPAILKILPGSKVSLGPLTARLTRNDTGGPLSGRTVRFTTGGKLVCAAVTNANGQASCPVTVIGLLTTVLAQPLGFDATFAGDEDMGASVGHGPVARVGPISLL